MHSSNKLAFFNVYELLIDVISIIISYLISYVITSNLTFLQDKMNYIWVVVVYVPLWISIMSMSNMYLNTTFTYYDRIFRNIFFSSVFTSTFIAALMFFIKQNYYSRIFFVVFSLVTFVILLIQRYIFIYMSKKYAKGVKQVVLIGSQDLYEKSQYYLEKTNIKVNIHKYLCINRKNSLNDCDILKDIKSFEEFLKKNVIDEALFALPVSQVNKAEEYVLLCEQMGITVRIVTDLFDMKYSRTHVTSLGTLPMITFHSISLNNLQLFIKRCIDIVGALVGIILISPIFIITAIAIKIYSPGPVLFIQDRVGINGRTFKLYKFRSMYIDAEEKKAELIDQNQMKGDFMFKIKNDPRITPIGRFIRKTSIDELPQFINVLKGEMSLVGTRPPTLDEVSKYKSYHWRRISIKPGMTGMWQVSGRSDIVDFDEVVKLDVKYIDEWSLWLDIKILLKTMLTVLRKKGAC